MSIEQYLEKMKEIQNVVLTFLSNQTAECDDFQNLITLLNSHNIKDNKYELDSLLQLINRVSANFHHYPNFFIKIEQILRFLKDEIIQNYSNQNLFSIFKKNKRILLFLIKEQIMTIDDFIYEQMVSHEFEKMKYYNYFRPELISYKNSNPCSEEEEEEEEYIDDFDIKREIGENDNFICKLIREDSIKEFAYYMHRNNIPFSSKIEKSIFETNSFLMKREVTLIEYSAFFGSIKIFQYLKSENATLAPSIWKYAIHSQNEKLIHILENENVDYNKDLYKDLVYEAIKCHYNQLVLYFINKYCQSLGCDSSTTFSKVLKSYNFNLIQEITINEDAFRYLCEYGYSSIAKILIDQGFDTNMVFTDQINKRFIYDKEEKNVFHLAMLNDNVNMMEVLLSDNNFDINKPYKVSTIDIKTKRIQKIIEKTPLTYAVENNRIELVKLFLSCKKIDVNLSDKEFRGSFTYYCEKTKKITPLFYAVENENVEIIKLLLSNENIDVNLPKIVTKITQDNEDTPLTKAIQNENIEIVKLLLNCKNIDINKPRVDVCYDDYGDTCCLHTVSIETPFLLSLFYYRNTDILNLLMSNENIDISAKSVSERIYYNQKFEKGRETYICIWESSPIITAIRKNDYKAFDFLSSLPNFDVNSTELRHVKEKNGLDYETTTEISNTPLACAAYFNRVDLAKHLLSYKNIDINALIVDLYEKSSLYIAAEKGNIEIMKILLECESIDVNLGERSSTKNITPLHIAICNDYEKEVKLLLSCEKVDLNILYKDEYVKTSLFLCIEYDRYDILDIILEREDIQINELSEIDIDEELPMKETALHLAVINGNVSVIEKLLSHKGIDINIKDSKGKKPIEYTNDEQIIQLFKAFE